MPTPVCLVVDVQGTPTHVVSYHGSITEHHGPYYQLAVCDCHDCDYDTDTWVAFGEQGAPPTRWVLHSTAPGSPVRLEHVRPESFSCVPAPRKATP